MRLLTAILLLVSCIVSQDVLTTEDDLVYIGIFMEITDTHVVFKPDGISQPQYVPLRLVQSVVLEDGKVLYNKKRGIHEDLAENIKDKLEKHIEELSITQVRQKAKEDAKADISKSKPVWLSCSLTSIPVFLGFALINGELDILDRLFGEVDILPEFFIALSLSHLTPFVAQLLIPIKLPQKRIDEIAALSDDYKEIYGSTYRLVIKTQRLKYYGIGVCTVNLIGWLILFSMV